MNTKQVEESTPPCTAEEGKFSGDGDGEDEVVECELEAAQTLAYLAGRSEVGLFFFFFSFKFLFSTPN